MIDLKPHLQRALVNSSVYFIVGIFGDRTTTRADQKLPGMVSRGITTTNICVNRFEFVHQANSLEKIQRSIYGRRRGPSTVRSHSVEKIVGFDRSVTSPDQLEYSPPLLSKPFPPLCTNLHGARDRVIDAPAMIMIRRRKMLNDAARLLFHYAIKSR